jgi:uncharacterized protein YlxP (DUF503 family)
VYVGVCRLVLHAGHCHSLKEKRAVIRRIKDRARTRLDLTIAEVAAQDTWQRIVLGFAIVGGDQRRILDTMSKAVELVEEAGEARVLSAEREVMSFKAGEPLADIPAPEDDQSWVPPEWLEADDT